MSGGPEGGRGGEGEFEVQLGLPYSCCAIQSPNFFDVSFCNPRLYVIWSSYRYCSRCCCASCEHSRHTILVKDGPSIRRCFVADGPCVCCVCLTASICVAKASTCLQAIGKGAAERPQPSENAHSKHA